MYEGKQCFSSVSVTSPFLSGCQGIIHVSSEVTEFFLFFFLYLVVSKDKHCFKNKKYIYYDK